MKREIHVAPDGVDFWNGQYREPLESRLDGPIVGLRQALHMAREWRRNAQSDGPVTIWMADGRYPVLFPLEFGPEDYGVAAFKAYPGARPTLDMEACALWDGKPRRSTAKQPGVQMCPRF